MKKIIVCMIVTVAVACVAVVAVNRAAEVLTTPDGETRRSITELEIEKAKVENEGALKLTQEKASAEGEAAARVIKELELKTAADQRLTETRLNAEKEIAHENRLAEEAKLKNLEMQKQVHEAEAKKEEARAASLKEECTLKTLEAERDYEAQAKLKAEKDAEEKRKAEEAWRKDGHAAMQLINHVNWVVTKILHHNDPVVLEREYNSVNQNGLRLDTIHDQETIDTIKAILDVIVSLRIDAKDREFLQEDLDDDMAENMRNAIPDVGSLISINPYQLAANVATAAFAGYMNYQRGKKKLLKKHKRATWELDKTRMKFLNELNKELLVKHWMLVERYKLSDKKRVVEDDMLYLINRLKDVNPERKLKFLNQNMCTYDSLPVYWYYRAQAAYDARQAERGDEEEMRVTALESIQKFFDIHVDILRHDRTVAFMAMMKINLMKNPDEAKDEIGKLVGMIEENALPEDWSLLYFAAVTRYARLGEKDKGIELLSKVVDELEFRRDNKLIDWKGSLANEDVSVGDNNLPSFAALSQCRLALANLQKGAYSDDQLTSEVEEIVQQENLAEQEKLCLYGMVKAEDVLKSIEADVRGLKVWSRSRYKGADEFYVKVPYKWLLNNEKPPKVFACWTGRGAQERMFELTEYAEDGVCVARKIKPGEQCEEFRFDRNIKDFKKQKCTVLLVEFSFAKTTLGVAFALRQDNEGEVVVQDEHLTPISFTVFGETHKLDN